MKKPIAPHRVQTDLRAYLDTMLQEQVNARAAAARVGESFDPDTWVRCFSSSDPEEQALRSAVLFPFANGFNCLNELLRRASWIKYGHEPAPPEDMKTIYRALRQDGALTSELEKILARLNSAARNTLTHGYPRADPMVLREAILEFDRIQQALLDVLDSWLAKKGYSLIP